MSWTIAVPDGTTSVTGDIVPSGTAHGVLADSSDSTLVALDPGELVWCTFGAPSPAVPGTARVTRMDLQVRSFIVGTGGKSSVLQATLATTGADDRRNTTLTNGYAVTWVAAQITGAYDPGPASFALKNVGTGTVQIEIAKVLLVVCYAVKPVTDVTAPTGTLTEDNRPTVTWSNTLDAEGGSQFGATAKIFSAAQYGAGGFDPATSTATQAGTITGAATSWQPPSYLPNATYRAYAKVDQNPYLLGSLFSSDYNYEGFVVNVPTPDAPTLGATAEPAASPVGRVKLTLAANGATSTQFFQVDRKIGSGEWQQLRTKLGDGRVAAADTTIYDWEAEQGVVMSYRARAIHSFSASESFSNYSSTQTATLTTTSWSVVHPTTPSLSANVELRSFAGYGREARQNVIQPIGRSDAVTVGTTRGPETGEITFRLRDDAALATITALATAEVPLLLRPRSGDHEPDRWVKLGDEQITRLVDQPWATERDGVYGWTEVARPVADLSAWS